MYVVAIAGPLGSGKSTLGRLISSHYPTCKILPFAYPLKKAAVDLGWDGKKDAKGRRLLQLLGTEIGRECIDENIWVNKWEGQRSSAKGEAVDIVIADDMRFLNEVNHVLYLRGITIKIFGRDAYESEIQKDHASELGLDDKYFDFIWDNSGTLEDMEIFAKTVVDYLNV
jgi:hypothetical protein